MPRQLTIKTVYSKPIAVAGLNLSRLQALWLAKRMETESDSEATMLVASVLGGDEGIVTRRTVDGWKKQETFAKAYAALGGNREGLFRGLSAIFFMPLAWDGLRRLLASENLKDVANGLNVYMRMVEGMEKAGVSAQDEDPFDDSDRLAEVSEVRVIEVVRGGRSSGNEEALLELDSGN